MTRGRWIAVTVTLLLIAFTVAWFTGLIGPDRRLSAIQDLQAKLGDQSLSPEEKRATWEELGKKLQELPEDLRFKAMMPRGGGGGGPFGPGGGQQRMKAILFMPEKERNAELDKQIDRMVEGAKRWEQAQKDNAAKPNAQAGSNTSPQGTNGGPGGPGGGGGPPGGFRPPTDAQMTQFRNRMLSSIPADTRASFGTMRQLMQARAAQRGTPLPQFGPR
jgi:hypothetical protein